MFVFFIQVMIKLRYVLQAISIGLFIFLSQISCHTHLPHVRLYNNKEIAIFALYYVFKIAFEVVNKYPIMVSNRIIYMQCQMVS
jgi:hypothetical protein